jgi:hypothetical protein
MHTPTNLKPVYELHREHLEWINRLSFFEDEIKILQHRLEDVARANNKKDIMAMVEHFQNQLFVQRNEIDVFKHDIKLQEKALMDYIEQNPQVADKRKAEDHAENRERFARFDKLFYEMKHELIDFAAKVL